MTQNEGRKFVAEKLWARTAAGPFLAAHLKSPQESPPSQGGDTLSMGKAIENAMKMLENPGKRQQQLRDQCSGTTEISNVGYDPMERKMKAAIRLLCCLVLISWSAAFFVNAKRDTETLFKNAGESAAFFKHCYGYAVFPTIGKGGLVVGGAHGSGHVYVPTSIVGDTSMTQVTVDFRPVVSL
jgi:hypothetical protein